MLPDGEKKGNKFGSFVFFPYLCDIDYKPQNRNAMNKEEKFVITISRQFGTGGHEIGAELAKRLGVKLLDKQILNEVAKRFSVVEEAVEKIGSRNPLWRDDFTNFYRTYMAGAEYNGAEHDQTSHELFGAQAEAIRKIADEESCVIIGRCGFDIFRNVVSPSSTT